MLKCWCRCGREVQKAGHVVVSFADRLRKVKTVLTQDGSELGWVRGNLQIAACLCSVFKRWLNTCRKAVCEGSGHIGQTSFHSLPLVQLSSLPASCCKDTVDLFCDWIAGMSEFPGVDRDRIGVFGFSAGAYAVSATQPAC